MKGSSGSNGNPLPSPKRFANLVELLRERARQQPRQVIYTFLTDGERDEQPLTYAQLDHGAQTIAARLQQMGATGERALLLYPPSLEYITAFFGCLYAGAIPVPAYPPHRARFERASLRLRTIIENARPVVALTTSAILPVAEAVFSIAGDTRFRWLSTDSAEVETHGPAWQPLPLDEDSLAFLQYTSGSTSAPKGVMLTHGNLLHNLALMDSCFGLTASTPGVVWLPPYHDMGLIGGLLQPLYAGCPITLLSPMHFLQRPLRWLEAVSRYRAMISGGPNFAFELCVRKTTAEQRAQLDLSSWEIAFVGAEPVRADTLRRFAEAFEPCGFRREAFYPCYGLAEATLIVSGGRKDRPAVVRNFQANALRQHHVERVEAETDVRTLVGCGDPLGTQHVAIVDPETGRQSRPGEVGEIWLSGPSVAQGYWGRPEETLATFHAQLADAPGKDFLRTGDFGFLDDGELFITGRLKDLIIIHGRNHYPQDIEQTVEQSHAALRPGCGAACSVEIDGEERLVVVQEVDRQSRKLDFDEVASAIRRAVAAEHEIQVYAVVLIKTGTAPKTSSGKIQRHACREGFLAGSLETLAESRLATSGGDDDVAESDSLTREEVLNLESDALRRYVPAYLQRQLGRLLNLTPEQLQPQQRISDFGLDSLLVVELQHSIETDLGLTLSMAGLLGDASLGQLTEQVVLALEQSRREPSAPVEAAERTDTEVPMSYGQRAIFYLHQLTPESTAYNIVRAVRIKSKLDAGALRRALQALLNRHGVLRSAFVISGGEPVRRLQAETEVRFEQEDASTWDEAQLRARLEAEAARPLDIEQGEVLRVRLFTRTESEHVLLLAVHHIASDLWSLTVLVRELGLAYQEALDGASASVGPTEADYADYVRWQKELLDGAEGERLWNYWRRQLSGELPLLDLPTDRPRPPIPVYEGGTQTVLIGHDLTLRLKALGREHGATLYMTLLASFQTLLHRYTGQTDILVGSPAAGRRLARFRNVVGYFVNPLVLRAGFDDDPTFETLLRRTRQTVLEAFDHQDFPLGLLAERLELTREPGRSPLFQVMFVMQGTPMSGGGSLNGFATGEAGTSMTTGPLRLESVSLEQRTTQFDLTLVAAEIDEGLRLSLEYNSDLFDAESARRILDNFRVLLEAAVAHPEQKVIDLPLLTEAERRRLIVEWNATAAEYDSGACLQHLFETQAERTPEAVAVISENEQLTYRDLNDRADRLATRLRGLGLGPESLVGICVERSPRMVVGLLGILKAGCAYVPLDPAYPQSRLALIIEDTKAEALVTEQHLVGLLPESGAVSVCLDLEGEGDSRAEVARPLPRIEPQNLAYIIYTSGSTGRPKGVGITHSSAVAFLNWARSAFTRDELARVLASTSISFDLSVFEIFCPLSVGGALVLAEDALRLPELTDAAQVTLINTVPSVMTELLRMTNGRLPGSPGVVNLAGEPLQRVLVNQLYDNESVQKVFNLYGPSEDTTYSTCALMQRNDERAPSIGLPISNTQAYLLDRRLRPVPVGVVGELHLGGAGLARGYLRQPATTAEKFIPNPFSPEAGARLYKTGDMARRRRDGQIEFLGRADHQVKLRGFRIELGEIEAVLGQHPGVAECAVAVSKAGSGDGRLAAYVVPQDDAAPPAAELRGFLRTRLPEHMVPASFVTLASLPRTANGKLDRRALPALSRHRPETDESFVEPRTDLERELARLWGEVLELDRVGVHDGFFELGGHSLLAARLISRMQDAVGIAIPLRRFFESPTVAGVAAYVETARWSAQRLAGEPLGADNKGREEGRL